MLKEAIVNEEGVTSKSFFLTGSSNRGMMTFRIAIEALELFKAYAAIISSFPVKSECKPPQGPVALFMLNGTDDPLMPWQGGAAGRPGDKDEIVPPEGVRDIWTALNKSELEKTEVSKLPDLDTRDGRRWSSSRVVKTKYFVKMPLEFYRIDGGGHSLPSKIYQIPGFLRELCSVFRIMTSKAQT